MGETPLPSVSSPSDAPLLAAIERGEFGNWGESETLDDLEFRAIFGAVDSQGNTLLHAIARSLGFIWDGTATGEYVLPLSRQAIPSVDADIWMRNMEDMIVEISQQSQRRFPEGPPVLDGNQKNRAGDTPLHLACRKLSLGAQRRARENRPA
ncbi:MAG: hypothetical protein OXC53_03105, partial [Rhodobacteraceae bacterium]|nr:hypothetical protein [Paracoccaceae bacterium]